MSELSNPHDRFFKAVWSRRQIGRDFLRHYLPAEVVAQLDLGSLQLSRDSFIDERLRGHYSDLLYRLKRWDDIPVHLYVLVEHQRTPDRSTSFQLLRYLVRIGESALATSDDPTKLPVVIAVVLYQGDTPWPYGQSFQDALQLPAEFASYVPQFRYVLCDLSALSDADIKGEVWLRVAIQGASSGSMPNALRRAARRSARWRSCAASCSACAARCRSCLAR